MGKLTNTHTHARVPHIFIKALTLECPLYFCCCHFFYCLGRAKVKINICLLKSFWRFFGRQKILIYVIPLFRPGKVSFLNYGCKIVAIPPSRLHANIVQPWVVPRPTPPCRHATPTSSPSKQRRAQVAPT